MIWQLNFHSNVVLEGGDIFKNSGNDNWKKKSLSRFHLE